MENKVKLYEICDDLSDGLHAAPLFNPDGEYLFVNAINLENGYIVDTGDGKRADYSEYVKYKIDLNKRTILYSIDGTIGKIAKYRGEKVILGKGACYIKLKESVNADYIYYLLQSALFQGYLKSMTTGSTIHHISLETMRNFLFELPPRDVQDCIAGVLSTLDAKIDNNIHLCAELEATAKTLYDYWFVQFDFPDENGKPYRTSGGAMEWCQELGREVPKGWKAGKYSNLIESVRTGLNPRQNFTFSEGGIRYLTVKNLTQEGRIDFTGCDTIDEDARAIVHRRSDISIGDVLFASIAPLGRCYLIQSNPDDWDINESVFSLRPNYSNCTSDFLYLTLKSDQFIAGSTNSSTGSIFKGIRINTLLDMTTLIPPIDTLNTFSDQVSAILHKQESLFSENEQLTHIRDWLLPMLMNGQATIERNN